MKRIVGFSSPLVALGLLGTFSYAARELIAALVIFSVGSAALFLIAIVFLLCLHVTDQVSELLQVQPSQRNQASRDWIVGLFKSGQTPVLVAANVAVGNITIKPARA
ncbi:MAG TPA: hypothetical protein VJL59_15975 [Anaerolineales bacterium]|nr:hypothetical protein [Anaerolineales bacterium]